MATAVSFTIGASATTSVNYQSAKTELLVAYELDRGETLDDAVRACGQQVRERFCELQDILADKAGTKKPAAGEVTRIPVGDDKTEREYPADPPARKSDKEIAGAAVERKRKEKAEKAVEPAAEPEAKAETSTEEPKARVSRRMHGILDSLPDPRGDRSSDAWKGENRTNARKAFQDLAARFALDVSNAKATREVVDQFAPALKDVEFGDFSAEHWKYASEMVQLEKDPDYDPFAKE